MAEEPVSQSVSEGRQSLLFSVVSKHIHRSFMWQVECEEEQVRAFFARQRSAVRSFLQRAQRKAGVTAGTAAQQPSKPAAAATASATAIGSGGKPLAQQPVPAGAAVLSGSLTGGTAGGGTQDADGAEGPSSPLAAVRRAAAGRDAALRRLGLLLDEGGGLRDSSVTGR